MKVRENREHLSGRVRLLTGAITTLLGAVASVFWFVQIVHGSFYRDLADNNRLRKVPIKAPRGLIYDRKGRILVENVPSFDLLLDRSRTADLEASLAWTAEVLGQPVEELRALIARNAKSTVFAPVLLAERLTLPQAARISAASLEHPELQVEVRHLRFYPNGRETAHVLGYLGEVSEAELARAGAGHGVGDLVGRKGIEEAYDYLLRGADGERVLVVDSRGKPLERHDAQPAQAGKAMTLTIDLELQRLAEEKLGDRVGAVVALEPDSGEILAMVASPSYDPNLFARRLAESDWQALATAPQHPLQNRAIQSTYPPGSPFKIVMAAAALSEGVIRETDTVYCGGSTTLYNHRFRCWKRGGHGRMNLHQALVQSCDVYFYHLGQKLGIERIADYARRFGLGVATGVDLRNEKAGLVPDPGWSLERRRTPWYPGETISVAIGQGPLLTTPLQMATLTAVLANGGRRVTPRLALDPRPVARARPSGIAPAALEPVVRGLWGVVNETEGTGSAARVPGLGVAGKTGTAQVVAQSTWVHNENLPPERRDHAWFVSFAPAADPALVVVVFVEHGGKGSAAAAPIAKALYERYFATRLGNLGP